MGYLEEHVYLGDDGPWFRGRPTKDTMLMERLEGSAEENDVNDIFPSNVTHINRVPIENVEFLAQVAANAVRYPL
jgi:hypothetical protein